MNFITELFSAEGFTARWSCGPGWSQFLGWLHIVGDIAVFGAYAAIPAVLALFLSRRRDIPFPSTGWLFVAFILSCGVTHLVDAMMFYYPAYRILGVMKAITAAVSWTTVASMVLIMPAVLGFGEARLENERLRTELRGSRDDARTVGLRTRDAEARSADLALRALRMRGALDSAGVAALTWRADDGVILWRQGAALVFDAAPGEAGGTERWDAVVDGESVERLRRAERRASATGERIDVSLVPMRDASGFVVRLAAKADPPVVGEPSTFTGMARLTRVADAESQTP